MIEDATKVSSLAFEADGDEILLVGRGGSHLGRSMYLREILGREEGAPPPVDLKSEVYAGRLLRTLVDRGDITASHDISDGGLLVALAEMALAGKRGAVLSPPPEDGQLGWFFGEDQGRYVVSCPEEKVGLVMRAAMSSKLPVVPIGRVGGGELICEGVFAISLEKLSGAYENWLPEYMSRRG